MCGRATIGWRWDSSPPHWSGATRGKARVSEKQHRDKITTIKKEQAKQEAALGKARSAAAGHRRDAHQKAGKITSRTSTSMARSYARSAEDAEKKAVAEDAKATAASAKLGRLAQDLASAEEKLQREMNTAARRAEDARRAEARRREQDDAKRRQAEKRHAQEVSRLSRPTVVHQIRVVPAPQPEILRVLYLTANPDMNLRVDAEVRQVQQVVKAALHRDLIEIAVRPAATPEDLLDGLNDVRPHVVHFAGHSGGSVLVFDNASVETPEGREMTFDLLARSLAATATPPALLVLNGCETLDGAEVLLEATPVVIGMAATITDLAATTFAARFYGAIASAQPIQGGLDQGALAVDFLGLDEGWKPNVLARPDVAVDELVLVTVPPAG